MRASLLHVLKHRSVSGNRINSIVASLTGLSLSQWRHGHTRSADKQRRGRTSWPPSWRTHNVTSKICHSMLPQQEQHQQQDEQQYETGIWSTNFYFLISTYTICRNIRLSQLCPVTKGGHGLHV